MSMNKNWACWPGFGYALLAGCARVGGNIPVVDSGRECIQRGYASPGAGMPPRNSNSPQVIDDAVAWLVMIPRSGVGMDSRPIESFPR